MKITKSRFIATPVIIAIVSTLLVLCLFSAEAGANESQKSSGGLRIVNQSKATLYFFSVWDLWGELPTNFFFGTIQPESNSMWIPFPKNKSEVNLAGFAWLEKGVNAYNGFSYHDGIPGIKPGQWIEYIVKPSGGGGGVRVSNKPFNNDDCMSGSLGTTRVLQMRGKINNLESVEKEWRCLLFLSFVESIVYSKFQINMPEVWMLGYYGSALANINLKTTIHERNQLFMYRVALNKKFGEDRFNEYFNAGYEMGERLLGRGQDPVVTVKKSGAGEIGDSGIVGDSVSRPFNQTGFTNSLGMKFVSLPFKGAKFDGSSVLFSVWETRNQDFKAFVDATGYDATKTSDGKVMDVNWKRYYTWWGKVINEHPVIYVSWEDAQAFCVWLTKKERDAGTIAASQKYRLATDHEWSCAVGIGGKENALVSPRDKSRKVADFPWGVTWPPPKGSGNYDKKLLTDDFDHTSPVGSFRANALGIYDMGGNVWEWCEDKFDGSDDWRVLRGGSWSDSSREYLSSSYRRGSDPVARYDNGFRCVLE